jgi:hypothetical protein
MPNQNQKNKQPTSMGEVASATSTSGHFNISTAYPSTIGFAQGYSTSGNYWKPAFLGTVDSQPQPYVRRHQPPGFENISKKKQADTEVAKAMPHTPHPDIFAPSDNELITLLRDCLTKAFDEGAESPYDLKESIVDGIEREIQERVTVHLESEQRQKTQRTASVFPKLEEIVDAISPQIPDIIKESMRASNRCFLAGGKITKMLIRPNRYTPTMHAWRESDWDLFVHTDDAQKLPVLHCSETPIYEKNGPYDKFDRGNRITSVYYAKIKNLNLVNVIAGNYNKLEDVLESFDFRFLQMGAYYDSNEQLQFRVLTPQAWFDLMHNIIHYQDKSKIENRGSDLAIQRVAKYVARGFRDCTGLTEKGILQQWCIAFSNTD